MRETDQRESSGWVDERRCGMQRVAVDVIAVVVAVDVASCSKGGEEVIVKGEVVSEIGDEVGGR